MSRYDERLELARESNRDAARRHQNCTGDEGRASANPVRLGRKREGNGRIAGQNEGKEQADLGFGQSEPGQVKDQDYSKHAVREKADRAGHEKELRVSIQRHRPGALT